MVTPAQLSAIHAQMRRQMNADVSASLRRHGVTYGLAFGVPVGRLAEIAATLTPSVELAEALWAEDIRESKMLATRLYPHEALTRETALRWVEETPHDEVADQLVVNLLSRVGWADELARDLSGGPERMKKYVALKTAVRIGCHDLDEAARTIVDDATADMALRTAAYWLTQEER